MVVTTTDGTAAGVPSSRLQPSLVSTGEILTLIRTGQASTKRELSEALGLARSTVSQRLDLLVRESIVYATLAEDPGRGRPAAAYSFNPEVGVVLVGHFGVSGSHVGVTNLRGEVLIDSRIDYPAEQTPDSILNELETTFDSLLDAVGRTRSAVWGIGIGLPSLPEMSGEEKARYSTRWEIGVVADRLERYCDAPVFVENDVNMIALGEFRAAWSDTRVFLCVKVGTGIGCGIVINGELIKGFEGSAGDIGHTHVSDSYDTQCQCGGRGCLSSVASGPVLASRLRDRNIDAADAKDVARLVREGVPEAAQEVRQAGRHVGKVLSGAVNLLNPEVIVVWGYLADANDQLLAGIKESLYEYSLPLATRNLRLAPATLGDNAGISGGAQMVLDHVVGPASLEKHLARSPQSAPAAYGEII